jgi:hypothetical protein
LQDKQSQHGITHNIEYRGLCIPRADLFRGNVSTILEKALIKIELRVNRMLQVYLIFYRLLTKKTAV